ncbi:MAG: TauD/TfdA family dioxygenase [Pseudomonadota bacterium]|jgi:alpha-ketoglutarate-dependent 2,4-dichlorophenoxyacetate dioxygenase|nr:TauD/TfdA family dioxygenase [Pseudomonadota bacterium]MEC9099926.1 TauD/TfdA family dioxygenase [Pseudomonadota bacterium]
MAVEIRQVGDKFAGEVTGIDLTKPLSTESVSAIHDGMDEYAVLFFRGQPLTADEQLAFSKQLGEIEHAIGTSLRDDKDARLPTTFADVSNLDRDERPFDINDRRRLFAIGNRLWHSDSSFKVIPAKYSILHAISIPSRGGNTEFAHMPSAYDALDEEIKGEIDDLICEHSQIFSRQQVGFTELTKEEIERFEPVRQRLIRRHPKTGRKSLYLSSHAGRIDGLSVPDAKLLLLDLVNHATQKKFVYIHKWQMGDLVMWDNRQTMHRVRPFPVNEPRDMRRTTIVGDGPTVVQ